MSQKRAQDAGGSYYFGTFELDPKRRELLQDGQALHLRTREFDILLFLIENAGQFVTKDKLIERVWPMTTVSESNIRVQIAALRRVLGDGRDGVRFILSAAGRGYSFCCPLGPSPLGEAQPRPIHSVLSDVRHNLPIRIKVTVGRGEVTNRIISHLLHHRLVTIVGPGGIGKTTLALTIAEQLVDAYDDGVRFVDLAGLSDPDLVPSAMASTVGPMKTADPEEELIKLLEDKQILFVIDNCEHLVGAVARLVERVLTRARNIHFLATSREPLRIDGEWLSRLGSLDSPPSGANLSVAEAIAYPAVKLFVERARLSDSHFELSDSDAAKVAVLCRRLDGNPLAIELAAARVGLFGVPGLVAQLEESFSLLTQGRRTALPRHQTLRATLDWSYDLLSSHEQALLYQLAIFRGEFTLAMARAVVGSTSGFGHEIIEDLAELAAKSLVNADVSRHPAHYRMLFITRDYALQKLRESGKLAAVSRRHAQAYVDLLTTTVGAEKDSYAVAWIEDIRAAIDWAFSGEGDLLLGMQLTRSSSDFGAKLSLLPEYARRIDKALGRIAELDPPQPYIELRLLVERWHIAAHMQGNKDLLQGLADRAQALADGLFAETGDATALEDILVVRFSLAFGAGNYPETLKIAQEARNILGRNDEASGIKVTIERFSAQAHFFSGEHLKSVADIHKVLSLPLDLIKNRKIIAGDRINPEVTVRIFLARNQWILGETEKASQTANEAFMMSETNGLTNCYVLGMATIPVALWRGDLALARANIKLMLDLAQRHGLGYWARWALNFRSIVAAMGTDYAEGDELAEPFHKLDLDALQLDQAGTFHDSLCGPAVLKRVEEGLVAWNAPEIWRVHGEALLAAGMAAPDTAEALFVRSLETARQRQALSWQLRTATSLARLWGYQGRVAAAQTLLDETLAQFTEGFSDGDFIAGEALMKDLEQRADGDMPS